MAALHPDWSEGALSKLLWEYRAYFMCALVRFQELHANTQELFIRYPS